MHHVVLDRWSRGRSFIHARDARAKLAVVIVLLVAIATLPPGRFGPVAASWALVCLAAALSRLPVWGLAWRAGLVLPFSAVFAAMSWLSGDAARGVTLLAKSYASAFAVIFLLSVTPFPDLCRAAEWFRAPRMLILLMQFIYRYIFVISEQAQHMWLASHCRGGSRRARFRAAAGAVGVLFARSYQRAEGIQRAMFARGFRGRFETLAVGRFGLADFAFLSGALLLIGAARAGGGWLWSR